MQMLGGYHTVTAGNNGRRKVALDIALPTAFIIWSFFSYKLPAFLAIPAIVIFIGSLFARSCLRFSYYFRDGGRYSSFGDYMKNKGVVKQNLVAGIIMGTPGIVLRIIVHASSIIGKMNLLLLFDILISAVIVVMFFFRPGKWTTVERAEDGYGDYSDLLQNLATQYGVNNVELRVIPVSRTRTVNASSWGLPLGRNFVFATEGLFLALLKNEVGGIFTHELAHLKYRHSSKSFLISSFVPLLWLNGLVMPLVLNNIAEGIASLSASLIFAAVYIISGRGILSRHFENVADRFAARHWNREVYMAALKRLAEVNGDRNHVNERVARTHSSLEEREKLIRSQ